jgi:hypothetical protein
VITRTITIAGLTFAALVMIAPRGADAQGVGGGGIHAGAPSGLQVNPGPNLNLGGMINIPQRRPPQRFRDLKLAGRVGIDTSKLPATARIVRLRLDGRDIPMRLDTELSSAEIQFDPDYNYARELYRAILTKRVEVVGAAELRDELAAAANSGAQVEVEGYAFNLTSPYLVLKVVNKAP